MASMSGHLMTFSLVTSGRSQHCDGYMMRAEQISREEVKKELWSQLIQGLKDNGLASHPFDKMSAWGIQAAICYYLSSTVLKTLQLINFTYQTEQLYRKCCSTIPVSRVAEFLSRERTWHALKAYCP